MGIERKSRAQTHHIPLVKVTDYQKTVFSMEVTPLPSGTKTFSCFCQKSMKVATARNAEDGSTLSTFKPY